MYLAILKNGESAGMQAEPNFSATCDLIVAGLGTAGAAAAISAAERGLSVLAIERLTLSGGSATAGGVFGYYYGQPGGRFEETDRKSRELQEQMFVTAGSFHPDAKAIVMEEELTASGATLLWESSVIGIWLETAGKIAGVRLVTPEGQKDVSAQFLLDATGDGLVAAMAGANFTIGREFDGEGQPYSSVRVFLEKNRNNKLGMANFDAGYINADDPADMTRGIISGGARHYAWAGDKDNPLLWIAQLVGVREGRLIEGDLRLTMADFVAGKRPADPVCYAYSNFDSHSQDWALEADDIKDWMVASSLWGKNLYFPVPLDIMLVKGFENLLCAGRCWSVDHDIACALRMQRCLQKGGEALAAAVAMAVSGQVPIRAIDRHQLAEEMRRSGCLNDDLPADTVWTPDSVFEALAGEKPGEAIWFAGHQLAEYDPALREWLDDSNSTRSRHAALALGIGGDHAALPVLRRIVEERDPFLPATSRSHNQARILGTMHLLGKLADRDSTALLADVLKNAGNDFQLTSHATVALTRIGDRHHDCRNQIGNILADVFANPELHLQLLLKNSSHTSERITEPMTVLLRLMVREKLDDWKIAHRLAVPGDHAKLTLREQRLSNGKAAPNQPTGRTNAKQEME